MPIHDIAILGLILLALLTISGLRILWDIYKILAGFWGDYRKVNNLDDID